MIAIIKIKYVTVFHAVSSASDSWLNNTATALHLFIQARCRQVVEVLGMLRLDLYLVRCLLFGWQDTIKQHAWTAQVDNLYQHKKKQTIEHYHTAGESSFQQDSTTVW